MKIHATPASRPAADQRGIPHAGIFLGQKSEMFRTKVEVIFNPFIMCMLGCMIDNRVLAYLESSTPNSPESIRPWLPAREMDRLLGWQNEIKCLRENLEIFASYSHAL